MSPRRPGPDDMTTGEYVTLVVLVAGGLVVTIMFVTWVLEQRGMVAPGTVPRPHRNGGVTNPFAGDPQEVYENDPDYAPPG